MSKTPWLPFSVFCMLIALMNIDAMCISLAIPELSKSFAQSARHSHWLVNSFTMGEVAFLLVAGKLLDKLGAKPVVAAGSALFGVTSAALYFADSFGAFVALRLLQGVAAALCLPGVMVLLRSLVPKEAQGQALTILATVSAVSLSVGPLVGGWAFETIGWQGFFLLNVPFCVVASIFVGRAKLEHAQGQASINPLSLAAGTIAFGLLQICLFGQSSPALWILSAACVVVFVALERASSVKLIPHGALNARISAALYMGFAIQFVQMANLFFYSLFYKNCLEIAVDGTAARMSALVIPFAMISPFSSKITQRLSLKSFQVAGLCCGLLAAFVQLALGWLRVSEPSLHVAAMALTSLASASTYFTVRKLIVMHSDDHAVGINSALLSSFQKIGGMTSVGCCVVVLSMLAATSLTRLGAGLVSTSPSSDLLARVLSGVESWRTIGSTYKANLDGIRAEVAANFYISLQTLAVASIALFLISLVVTLNLKEKDK